MATVTTSRRRGINASAAIKVPCIAASTGDLTLSGEQTVDGIALVDGNRCFAKDQTDTTEIGIYKVSTGTWEREPDFDGAYDVVEGTIIPVSRGTANADTYWRVTNTGTITIGTTAITLQATTVLSSAILNDGSVKMIADFSPNVTDTYDLGTSSLKWEDLHLNGNGLIGGTLGVTGVLTPGSVTIDGVAQPSIPAQVTNHIRAGNTQIVSGEGTHSFFTVTSNITEDVFESVGPTGSGATNIWTAMDDIPTTATILLCHLEGEINSTGAGDTTLNAWASNGDDSTPTASDNTQVLYESWDVSGAGIQNATSRYIKIPLGPTNQDFLFTWNASNNTSEGMRLIYRGFITD